MSTSGNNAAKAAPTPLVTKGKPVDWLFVFKFNAENYPGYGLKVGEKGIFGGVALEYKYGLSQQYVYSSSDDPELKIGDGKCGATYADPLGATFAQVYDSDDYHYVLWNDQFYSDPQIPGCGEGNCDSPWGHSKGMLAWNDEGDGLVLQTTTPSWPASGSKDHPRETDGNTLGCVKDDDIMVSQHFFALKINKDDLCTILKGCANSSVATDPNNPQICKNGGPQDVQELVKALGHESKSTEVIQEKLSSGLTFISKPSHLHVPPWQLVSAKLDGTDIRTANWWAEPEIPSTTRETEIKCWDDSLGKPGAVDIAITGTWNGKTLGLTGGMGKNHNHAKIGVSTESNKPYTIYGDMNQQGCIEPHEDYGTQNCGSSQNGRGGMFYVLDNKDMYKSMTGLLAGKSAPLPTDS